MEIVPSDASDLYFLFAKYAQRIYLKRATTPGMDIVYGKPVLRAYNTTRRPPVSRSKASRRSRYHARSPSPLSRQTLSSEASQRA